MPVSTMSSDTESTDQDGYAIEGEDELLMHNYHTLPKNCKKYWHKRYSLFSKFDEGIYMTSELWFSVTPEDIAVFTARLARELFPNGRNVLDICCGGGGNTIQFANYFPSVGSVDINPLNMKCTMHNAAVYDVDDRIWSAVGDWNKMSECNPSDSPNQQWIPAPIRNHDSPTSVFDFVFCSPPWGGPSYKNADGFDVFSMDPFPIDTLCAQIMRYTHNYGLFLPRSTNIDQLRRLTSDLYGPTGKCRVIYLNQNEYCKGLLALFGPKAALEPIDYGFAACSVSDDSEYA